MKYGSLKYLLLTVLSFTLLHPINAQGDFSEKEKTVIYTHSMTLLRDFEALVNEIGVNAINDMEAAQSSSEAFLELFVNRQVLIYNDLDPAHQLSPFYEAETYVSNLLLWYHDGIDIDMDFENARVGNIMEHEDNVYSLDILLNKQINGNYLNRTQNKNKEELLFRIAFNTRSSGSYKIVGIRNSSSEFEIDYSQAMEEVNTEELNANELAQVEDGVKAMMNDYTNFLSLLSDPAEPEEDKVFYRESFMALFSGEESRIFNDLVPNPENYLLSPAEYLDIFKSGYANGINNLSLNTDSTGVGNVVKNEDDSYQVSADASKFFSGMYMDEEAVREMFPLSFKFVFEKSGSAFINFRVQSIDIETADFYAATGEAAAFEMPDQEISTISRKGLSLSVHAAYGYTQMENLDQASTGDNWASSSGFGFGAGVQLSYFFGDHIGLSTGILFNQYQGKYSLIGQFEDSELSQDVNGDDFYQNQVMELDSSLSHSYLAIPLLFNYTSGKPGKFGFYVEAGATFAYRLSSSYTVEGDEQLYGRYPNNPPVLEYLYLEELGFYDRENVYRTGEPELSNLHISAYASLGIVIPLGYFSSFKFGPEVYYGFSDINQGFDTYNIYGRVISHEKTALRKYGVKFSYVLKL